MAAVSKEKFLASSSGKLNIENFECEVKDKLTWNKEKWEQTSGDSSRMRKLVNSMNYWSKKLKPAMERSNIIITLYNDERDVKIQLLEVIDEILKLEKKVDIIGFSEFRNPRYLCIYFSSEEDKKYVEKNLRMIKDSMVVYLTWAHTFTFKIVKVHWLTMTMNADVIKQSLDKYFVFKDQKRESTVLMNGLNLASGKITFRASLKEGIDIACVPHILYIGGLEALVTVQGRPPLCLTCDKLGHIARECPTPFCGKCRDLMTRGHSCGVVAKKSSYASITKPKETAAEFDEWDEEDNGKNQVIVSNENKIESSLKLNKKPECKIQKVHGAVSHEVMNSKDVQSSVATKSMGLNCGDVLEEVNSDENDKEWGEGDVSEIEESDCDISDVKVVKVMENYLKELNEFKNDVLDGGGGDQSRAFCVKNEVSDTKLNDEMIVDAPKLKRKMGIPEGETCKFEGAGHESSSGWIKTYSRRSKGNRNRRTSQTKADKIFDKDEPKREFVFDD